MRPGRSTLAGPNSDVGAEVQQTADDGTSLPAGLTQTVRARMTSTSSRPMRPVSGSGTKRFCGQNYDEGYSVQQTPDGGFITAGMTYSRGAGENDVWLIRQMRTVRLSGQGRLAVRPRTRQLGQADP